jgi:hAT family C-terminal dimerisation region
MASSVSSERAFSAAGMTITKRRNRLKADVVEALQVLRFMFQRDLIFREPAPTSVLEAELEMELVGKDGDILLSEESDFEV